MPKAVSSDSPERFEGHIPPGALLNAFNTSDRINRYLIENLPLDAWKAKPVEGKGRTIAAIVAHMHNVRVDVAEGHEVRRDSASTGSLDGDSGAGTARP